MSADLFAPQPNWIGKRRTFLVLTYLHVPFVLQKAFLVSFISVHFVPIHITSTHPFGMAPDFDDLAMPPKASRFIDSVLGLITRTSLSHASNNAQICPPRLLLLPSSPESKHLKSYPLIRWISVCYGHRDVGESPCDGWVNNGGKH